MSHPGYAERTARQRQKRRLDGRDGQIAVDYAFGMSQEAIAEKHGITQSRVSQILAANRSGTDALTRDDHRAAMLARIAEHQRQLRELADMDGAPVTAGKDGGVVIDPETGVVVRDYAARLNAIRASVAVDERLAKLIGTDEPTRLRTDMTVSGLTEQAAQLAAEAREALDPDRE